MKPITRTESKARTRQRLIEEADRLFRERGYAATSIEQIAAAAGVTKGAVYGHFASKEDLLMSAIEDLPAPDYGRLLNDTSVPLRERLAAFGRAMAVEEATTDRAELAASLEFLAALLRNQPARERYAESLRRQLDELAADDADVPRPGTTPAQVWAIGHALFLGLRIDRCLAPEVLTADLFPRAYALLAGLYPGEQAS
jgi:AcrR family transcriptional regulator